MRGTNHYHCQQFSAILFLKHMCLMGLEVRQMPDTDHSADEVLWHKTVNHFAHAWKQQKWPSVFLSVLRILVALRKASGISLDIISKYHNYILLNISQMLYEYNIYDTVNQSEQSNCKKLYLTSYCHWKICWTHLLMCLNFLANL